MANWTTQGFAGKTFSLSARFVPPPEGIPSPALWGDESVVRERLANGTSEVRTTLRNIDLEFPVPPKEAVQFFRELLRSDSNDIFETRSAATERVRGRVGKALA